MIIIPLTKATHKDLVPSVNAMVNDHNVSFSVMPEVNTEMGITDEVECRIDGYNDPKNYICYRKTDGEILGIVYPVDVKYFDQDGILKDKSNKIYESAKLGYKYESRDNDIISFFPEFIKDGIRTTYNEYSLVISPIFIDSLKAQKNDDTILYASRDNSGVSIKYGVTFNGIKDVIIVDNPPLEYSFDYLIETNGFDINEHGVMFDKNRCIGDLGKITIEDSSGAIVEGEMECIRVSDYKYKLTVNIPEDFAVSSETVYPIFIDPVVFFYNGSDYYSNDYFTTSTADTTKCTTGGSFSNNSTVTAGFVNTDKTCRVLIKFPGLYSIMNNIIPYCTTASLDLFRYQAYSGSSSVYVEAYPEKFDWTTNYAYNAANYQKRYSLYYNNQYEFNGHTYTSMGHSKIDVGAAAYGKNSIPIRDVIRYDYFNLDKGILIKLSDETKKMKFFGANTSNSAYLPRITFSYNDFEADGIVSGGIYRLSPCTSLTTVSNYSLSSTPSIAFSVIDKTVSSTMNYPVATYPNYDYSSEYFGNSFNGYKSLVQDISQLFKVTYTGYGYTIQRISDNYYLKCVNGSALTFVSSDDTIDYTTRWFILKNGTNYLITHYFYNFLSVDNLNASNPSPIIQQYSSGMGALWNFELYSLDVPYIHQVNHTCCGVACSFMILEWLNVDISSYTEEDYKNYAGIMYADANNAPENFAFALFKKTYSFFSGNGFYGSVFGQTIGDFCCTQNTAHIYLDHPNNPLAINIGTEAIPVYDYSLACTYNEFFRIIKLNIDAGFPVILNTGGFSQNQIFNYSLENSGHYILCIGAYEMPSDDPNVDLNRIVVADPHYRSVNSGSTQSYAIVDLLFSDFYNDYMNNNFIIRHILW